MISQNQVIESLRKEAQSNKVSETILHVWALRERARAQVTLNGLHFRLKKEGFTFDKAQYVPLLKLAASLGLGRLKTDGKGNVVGLFDIKTTLQSVGKAAVGGGQTLRRLKQKPPFIALPSPPQRVAAFNSPPEAALGLTVVVGTKPVTFTLPKGLSDSELLSLVRALRRVEGVA